MPILQKALNGEEVYFSNVLGMTELNGNSYTVASATDYTFELYGTDSTNYNTFGITVTKIGSGSPTIITLASAHGLSSMARVTFASTPSANVYLTTADLHVNAGLANNELNLATLNPNNGLNAPLTGQNLCSTNCGTMLGGEVSASPDAANYPFVIDLTESFTGVTRAGETGTLVQDLYVVQKKYLRIQYITFHQKYACQGMIYLKIR